MQCGERLIWSWSLCRVRRGVRPTFDRWGPAGGAGVRGWARIGAHAMRAMPSGAFGARWSRAADRPSRRAPPARGPAPRCFRCRASGGPFLTEFAFDAPTVIRTKRDGGRLSDAAIDWVIDAYTDGRVADEQMSALLMAIVLRGMDRGEIARWTAAMLASGERLDFRDLRLPTVDKHSTGGVGDKTTIHLVPVVAACGAAVPQASGRGLGHTGGTLDKLESIAGFTAELPNRRVHHQLRDVGAAIFAAGESLPLIASSVMSKKLAAGAGALVLDVKVGSGALLSSEAQSRELAQTM